MHSDAVNPVGVPRGPGAIESQQYGQLAAAVKSARETGEGNPPTVFVAPEIKIRREKTCEV